MGELKGKKILVTGGAGFIGFHLCKRLSDLTSNLTIYDNLSSGKMENVKDVPKAKFVKGDILDLKKLLSLEKADLIYHLAAQVVVPYSMENPLIDFETNAKGTVQVLEKARKDDAKLVFASSAAVYGNPTVFPTPESIRFSPLFMLRIIQSCRRRILRNVPKPIRLRHHHNKVCQRLRFKMPRRYP